MKRTEKSGPDQMPKFSELVVIRWERYEQFSETLDGKTAADEAREYVRMPGTKPIFSSRKNAYNFLIG